ncbi:hypothetical protein MRB53_035219 [Persea americana]|uniref:Uncharacterized protein n=1 Tax=Persea americana TaxID=3435 RepID=A0ACC2K472_PERAE|nr:hypothetical protein MRB53_035219 [Persea americana]
MNGLSHCTVMYDDEKAAACRGFYLFFPTSFPPSRAPKSSNLSSLSSSPNPPLQILKPNPGNCVCVSAFINSLGHVTCFLEILS